ncbi:MAG: VOC family protein [Gemmatimonadota bacterium]|nr:VOC family protein [Gemmatimonadota bacterium]
MTADTLTSGHTERAQPESFRAVSLSASLTVKDVKRSVAWYRDAIGFTVDREYERDGRVLSVALKAGAVRILLNHDDGAKGLDRAKGEGFSLMLTTTQSVDEVAKRIKASGTTLITEPTDMPWGARAFRVQDPDGFKLAISSERPS